MGLKASSLIILIANILLFESIAGNIDLLMFKTLLYNSKSG